MSAGSAFAHRSTVWRQKLLIPEASRFETSTKPAGPYKGRTPRIEKARTAPGPLAFRGVACAPHFGNVQARPPTF